MQRERGFFSSYSPQKKEGGRKRLYEKRERVCGIFISRLYPQKVGALVKHLDAEGEGGGVNVPRGIWRCFRTAG